MQTGFLPRKADSLIVSLSLITPTVEVGSKFSHFDLRIHRPSARSRTLRCNRLAEYYNKGGDGKYPD